MNSSRLAHLYRQRAAIDLEIAEELDPVASNAPGDATPRRPRMRPRPPVKVVDPAAAAEADDALRRRGYRIGGANG